MEVRASLSYTPIKRIGSDEGKNSTVFLVDEPQLGGRLIVKEVARTNLIAQNVSSFFDEAKAMFATSHPNVVPIHYACETPEKVCLVMPYFPKGSLQAVLAARVLTAAEAIRLADGLLAGLGHVHSKGYVHFDIKPTNVLFGRRGEPLLADFGQTRVMTSAGVAHAPLMYVPAIPPEVFAGGVGSPATDIYQVGLLLWRCLMGETRYQAALAPYNDSATFASAVIKGKFPPRRAFLPHIPERLVKLIRRALRVDPAQRFHSASEFREKLARVPATLEWRLSESVDEMEWQAERAGKPSLVVRMVGGNPGWSTEVWTRSGGAKLRRAHTKELWHGGLSQADAFKRVAEVLAALE